MSKKLTRKQRANRSKRRQHGRLLSGLETLEARQMLTCTTDDTARDFSDQICDVDNGAFSILTDGNSFTRTIGGATESRPGANDVDLFPIKIDRIDIDYTFTANEFNSSGLDTYLRLFDEAGNELDSDDDDGTANSSGTPGDNAEIEFDDFPSTGIYYLGVSAAGNTDYSAITGNEDDDGNSQGRYTLTFEDPDNTIDEVTGSAPIRLTGTFTRGGNIDRGTDVDFWRIDGVDGQQVQLTLQRSTGNVDPAVQLFDDAGNEIAGTIVEDNLVRISKTFTFNDTDDFYIRASSFGVTTGGYFVMASEVDTDGNDQLTEAHTVLIGEAETGFSVDPRRDVDMFRVVIDDEGSGNLDFQIDLEATSGSSLDPFIRLFNASGTQLTASDNTIGTNRATINRTLPRGTYFVGASADGNQNYNASSGLGDVLGNSTGAFTLTVSDNNDEVDEISGASTSVPIGESDDFTNLGNIDHGKDVDLWRIEGFDGQSVNLTVRRASGDMDPVLRLFDDSGDEITGTVVSDSLELISKTFTFDDTDDFYIGVSTFGNSFYDADDGTGDGVGQSTGRYQISATDTSPDLDDQRDEAIRFLPGQTIAGRVDRTTDVDIYRIEVIGSGAQLSYNFALEGTDGLDPYLRLFNGNGSEITASDNNIGTSVATINHTFSSPGTYFLGASADNNQDYNLLSGAGNEVGNSSGSYTLTASDPDDEINEAHEITVGGEVLFGKIDVPTDVDLYEFEVRESTVVHIDIDGTFPARLGGLDSHLRLFSAAGLEIDSNDNGRSPGEFAPLPTDSYIGQPLSPGTYYVGVSGAGNDSYDINTGDGDTTGKSGTGGGFNGAYEIRIQQGTSVNTNLDIVDFEDDVLSLREAIDYANDTSGSQTITFDPFVFALSDPQVITLRRQTFGDVLHIDDDVKIVGPGANVLTISGDNDNRVILIDDRDDSELIDVEISGLSVSNGRTAESSLLQSDTFDGAGIRNNENLKLRNVHVHDNKGTKNLLEFDQPGVDGGGGIFHALGHLALESSTISNNDNGGVLVASGTVAVSNSTFSSNDGNGLETRSDETVIVRNSTFVDDVRVNSLTLHNTIVVGDGQILTEDSSNNIFANGAVADALRLDPVLKNNGGPTPTHALLAGSSAFDEGSNAQALDTNGNPLTTDQRGFDRISFGTVDIGAFESDVVVSDTDDLVVTDRRSAYVGESKDGVMEAQRYSDWIPNVVGFGKGDLNGDGLEDIVGLDANGRITVGVSTGSSFELQAFGSLSRNITWTDFTVADFDADGKDDVMVRADSNGSWWALKSTGSRFTYKRIATFAPQLNWEFVTGDFNGDGRHDVAGRAGTNGAWFVAESNGSTAPTSKWGRMPTSSSWSDYLVGDFDGDGLDDVAARQNDSAWQVAQSNGTSFDLKKWNNWFGSFWESFNVGDYDGNGADDIAGRASTNGDWWVAVSQDDDSFSNRKFGNLPTNTNWNDVQSGDFNGDENSDLIARADNGAWFILDSDGSSFSSRFGVNFGSGVADSGAGTFASGEPPMESQAERMAVSAAVDQLLTDFDQSGDVDFADFLILSDNFGNEDASKQDGDANGDQIVDFSDFLLLSERF